MFDPSTMQHLGDVRQREIIDQAERDRAGVPVYFWGHRVGAALIALGRKLIRAASSNDPAPSRIPHSLHSDL